MPRLMALAHLLSVGMKASLREIKSALRIALGLEGLEARLIKM